MFKRLAALAFALLVVAPAMAQAPPPVPVIPDANRYESFNIVSSTSQVGVSYPIFGSCEDLTVQVNGVPLTEGSQWTCASASGTSISLLPLPITDMVINFPTPITSGFLEVVGNWQPRRTTQPTNPGINRYEVNEALSGIIAGMRELKQNSLPPAPGVGYVPISGAGGAPLGWTPVPGVSLLSAFSLWCNNTASAAVAVACTTLPSGLMIPGAYLGTPAQINLANAIFPLGILSAASPASSMGLCALSSSSGSNAVTWTTCPNGNGGVTASGSAYATTGGMTSGSATLTLASAGDFKNGQGISVLGAGASSGLSPPTVGTPTVNGATGSTAYHYQLAEIDNNCGYSAASSAVSVSNGNATLGHVTGTATNNTVSLSWTNSGSPQAIAIYRATGGGAYSLLYISHETSYVDGGFSLASQRATGGLYCVPSTPPSVAGNDWIVSSISSGAGTATLTLATSASHTVSGVGVQHDDTAAMNADLATLGALGGNYSLPCGTFRVSNTVNFSYPNTNVEGQGLCTIVAPIGPSDAFQYNGTSISAFMTGGKLEHLRIDAKDMVNSGGISSRYWFKGAINDVHIDNPYSGIDLYDFNDVALTHIRVQNYWGRNTHWLYLHTGATSSDYACCSYQADVLGFGNSTSGDIGTSDIGYQIDGNVATIQGRGVSSIETPGIAFQMSNGVGNPSPPTLINITDFEHEFSNGIGIDLEAGSILTLTAPQVYGCRSNCVQSSSSFGSIDIEGGNIGGAQQNNEYYQNAQVTHIGGRNYDAGNPNEGGDGAGDQSGVVLAGGTSGSVVQGIRFGDPANSGWQGWAVVIASGAAHFNVSNNICNGAAQCSSNAGISNSAGTSSSQVVSNNSN